MWEMGEILKRDSLSTFVTLLCLASLNIITSSVKWDQRSAGFLVKVQKVNILAFPSHI